MNEGLKTFPRRLQRFVGASEADKLRRYDCEDDVGEGGKTLCAIRFGGYPEQVRGMSDAIFGGGGVEITVGGTVHQMKTLRKQYHRQVTHDGVYAEAYSKATASYRHQGRLTPGRCGLHMWVGNIAAKKGRKWSVSTNK